MSPLDMVIALDPEEAAFLAAIRSSPGEVMNRLAYADWLDERGRSTQAADERRIAPGMRVLAALGRVPFRSFIDYGNRKGEWYSWTHLKNPHLSYSCYSVPSDEWFEKVLVADEWHDNTRHWANFRGDSDRAFFVAAEAFTLLSPNEQDRLLQLAADHERRASLSV
jgi:uncharacterized protein (TIGR02996 family)